MESYMSQYNNACIVIESAIKKSKKIIICGPEGSGKTYLQKKYKKALEEKEYNTYHGVDNYLLYHQMQGRTCGFKNEMYWIEVLFQDRSKIANIFDDDFEYIELPLQYTYNYNTM
jgi:predicted AAA+ superfamily ATPase